VYLHKNFNEPIIIPDGVICIQFGREFNQPVNLPDSVIIARFGKCFNQPLILPKKLKNLQLGNDFNQPITLPYGITHAVFGKHFDQITEFPKTLEHLEFGKWYNKPITSALSNLRWLKFGDRFDSELDLSSMESLKHLEFGIYFNQPIDLLPDCLEYLSLSRYYRNYNNIIFPDSLKYLKLGLFTPHQLVLPKALEHLVIIDTPNVLPEFPETLKHLELRIGDDLVQRIGHLPDGITYLYLGSGFIARLPGRLPHSLRYLNTHYAGPLTAGMFPEGLEELHMLMFNRAIPEGVFPDSIKKLIFGRFNRTLKNLPKNLEHLDLGPFYDMPFSEHDLPKTLKTIDFGMRFSQPIDYLPSGMDKIVFHLGFKQPLPEGFTVKHLVLPYGYEHITDDLRKRVKTIGTGRIPMWVPIRILSNDQYDSSDNE
jgi:hypothetical protein